jgi:hypothetical protein
MRWIAGFALAVAVAAIVTVHYAERVDGAAWWRK